MYTALRIRTWAFTARVGLIPGRGKLCCMAKTKKQKQQQQQKSVPLGIITVMLHPQVLWFWKQLNLTTPSTLPC